MNKEIEFRRLSPDKDMNRDRPYIDIPQSSRPLYQDKVPLGCDPMGYIYLHGRILRSIATGNHLCGGLFQDG